MAVVVVGKIASVVVGLATMAIVTRHLGPEGFGHYRTVLTYVSLTAVLADLGLQMVALKEISKPGADARGILGAAMSLRLLASTVLLLVAATVALVIPYDPVVHRGIFLAILLYVAFQGSEFLAAVFHVKLAQAPRALAEMTGGLVTLAACWLVLLSGLSTLAMIAATVAGGIVTFAMCWYFACRLVPFRMVVDLARWRNLIAMGLPLGGSQVLLLAMMRGDTFILSLFHAATDVGIYGMPTKIFEILSAMPVIFAGMTMPLFAAALARRDEEGFGLRLGYAVETMLVFGVGIAVTFLVHAEGVLELIGGAAYRDGGDALRLVAVGLAALSLAHIYRFALMAREMQALVLRIDLLGACTGIGLYLLLIPPFSYDGAALATALNEFIVLAGLVYLMWRTGTRALHVRRLLLVFVGALAMAVCLDLLERLGMPMLLAFVVGGLVYLAALAALGVISRELIDTLRSKETDTPA